VICVNVFTRQFVGGQEWSTDGSRTRYICLTSAAAIHDELVGRSITLYVNFSLDLWILLSVCLSVGVNFLRYHLSLASIANTAISARCGLLLVLMSSRSVPVFLSVSPVKRLNGSRCRVGTDSRGSRNPALDRVHRAAPPGEYD